MAAASPDPRDHSGRPGDSPPSGGTPLTRRAAPRWPPRRRLIRGLIKAGLIAAFALGAASLLLKRRKALGLTGQMNGIDYRRKNFVHADMTARQFAAMQRQKNESFLTLWWRSILVWQGTTKIGGDNRTWRWWIGCERFRVWKP